MSGRPDLQQVTDSIGTATSPGHRPLQLASGAVSALLDALELTPKPALVDRRSNGSKRHEYVECASGGNRAARRLRRAGLNFSKR